MFPLPDPIFRSQNIARAQWPLNAVGRYGSWEGGYYG